MNAEKLAKIAESVRTGGPGSVRRKRKAVHKNVTVDEKKLKASLKKLGVNDIPGIEEVNLFKDDGTVIHFVNPKVQASISAASGTYVVYGTAETKKLQDLMPGILSQLGPDNLANLKMLADQLKKGGGDDAGADDDIPDLVENFEAVSTDAKAASPTEAKAAPPTEEKKE